MGQMKHICDINYPKALHERLMEYSKLLDDYFVNKFQQRSIRKEEITCLTCDSRALCKYAWDEYNTHGDCLAIK